MPNTPPPVGIPASIALPPLAVPANGSAPPVLHDSWHGGDIAAALAAGLTTPDTTILARKDGFNLFYPGKEHIVFGEQGSLKTWLMLFAAYQEIVKGNSVLYLDYEMSLIEILVRLRAFGLSDTQLIEQVKYIHPGTPIGTLERTHLADTIDARAASHPFTLAVIDSATGLMTIQGLDPNKVTDVETMFQDCVRPLAGRGVAVVLLDHVVKNRDSRGGSPAGSERKRSGLDGAGYEIQPCEPFGKGRHGKSYLYNRRDRYGSVLARVDRTQNIGTFHVVSDPATHMIEAWIDIPGTATTLTTPTMGSYKFTAPQLQQVLNNVKVLPGCGGAQAVIGVDGLQKAEKRGAAIKYLVDNGFLRDEGSATKKRLHWVRDFDVQVDGLTDV